jgi:hypothetical protein
VNTNNRSCRGYVAINNGIHRDTQAFKAINDRECRVNTSAIRSNMQVNLRLNIRGHANTLHPQFNLKTSQIFAKRKCRFRCNVRREIQVIIDNINVLIVRVIMLFCFLVVASIFSFFRCIHVFTITIHCYSDCYAVCIIIYILIW